MLLTRFELSNLEPNFIFTRIINHEKNAMFKIKLSLNLLLSFINVHYDRLYFLSTLFIS